SAYRGFTGDRAVHHWFAAGCKTNSPAPIGGLRCQARSPSPGGVSLFSAASTVTTPRLLRLHLRIDLVQGNLGEQARGVEP
ncbi:MAG TPA: hypothetical protein VIJ07_21135, partial [Dermatophilaceae bacterium]